jgi:glycosyltransferase involved in cell wall biosynthesis
MLSLLRAGVPMVASVHHAVVIDRDLELARERRLRRRLSVRRWYQFHHMQDTVAQRMPRVLTVSEQSRRDIVDRMGVDPRRIRVIPVAVDDSLFAPQPAVQRVPGRIFAVASSDVSLKGVVPLLHAVAALRRTHAVELVLLGEARRGGAAARTLRELGLEDTVRFVQGIDDAAVVRNYAEAEVAVVPSLYEGFSIPALQAMFCGVPLVATTAGALPEVAGRDGDTALLVPPGDATALAQAIGRLLDDPALRRRLSEAALRRSRARYSWRATARATAEVYREVLGRPGVYHRPMSDTPAEEHHHHTVSERLDAARAAAEEVVAEESGQLGGELNALAVPFEEVVAAVRAAIDPDTLAEREDGKDEGTEAADTAPGKTPDP